MDRLKLKELESWYNGSHRKPLVVWGARQVGKTYLIKELFAKKNFKDFVYIDLKKDEGAASFFSKTCDPNKYLSYIEARYGKKISNQLPLLLDEVQQCPQVLSSLKYFKQDFPSLPVIATGSMVRLALKHKEKRGDSDFLFPVGSISSINVYPLTFQEYLMNSNQAMWNIIKKAYDGKKPLEQYEHDIAMDALYEYLTIGGMPEAVSVFLENKSYVDVKNIIKELYSNYLSDMDSYNVSTETILKTRNVYKNIFSQLNKENKNFKVTYIEKGKSNRDYFNAYQWLELARIVYRSKKIVGKVNLPFSEEDGSFRLYLSDMGMFTYQSNVSQVDFFVKEKRNTLSGVFYENFVASEFAAREIPLFYWMRNQTNEFEFIVENNGLILPIDVKRGNGKLNSLKAFRDCNKKSTAIKISSNNFGYDKGQDILTIPFYEVSLLADDLKKNKTLILK